MFGGDTDKDDIWRQLTSSTKLERDRGVAALEAALLLPDNEENNVENFFILRILALINDGKKGEELPWETKLGLLLCAREVIRLHVSSSASESSETEQFFERIREICLKYLTDDEVRVRLAAGEVLGALCRIKGPSVYEDCRAQILELIRTNLERDRRSPSAENNRVSSNVDIFHDTAGWRHLETSMKCLQCFVDGCGVNGFLNQGFLDQNLLDLIFTSLGHTNRFVRETGFQTCATLVSTDSAYGETDVSMRDAEEDREMHETSSFVAEFGDQFARHLSKGLADNWSQVRLAASQATRHFLLRFPPEARERFYPPLLPRLCLNRYYVAEGVRIYSQETWRRVVGESGRHLAEKYIVPIVEYYVESTRADNHAVREAACQCIAELAAKLSPKVVEPHVDHLLATLLNCFQDESWPVRDMACVASGSFIKSFPVKSKPVFDQLAPLFRENLKDPISSVRQGAAVAIANTVRVYSDEILENLMEDIKAGLRKIKEQPEESSKYGPRDGVTSQFGVVPSKKFRDNDISLHENQTMYSCGSLAPKMGRSSGGCSDCKFRRPSEPWEEADGYVHLVAELSSFVNPEILSKLLPEIAEAARQRHFVMHYAFLETVNKRLPEIAKNIGKKYFKPYLEEFLEPMFYALGSDNNLASAAALSCVEAMSDYLGPNIFRGRVEQYNPRFLDLLLSSQRGSFRVNNPAMTTMPINISGSSSESGPLPLGGTPTGSPK